LPLITSRDKGIRSHSAWCETATMRNFLAAAATAVSDLLPGTLPVDSCLIYGTRRQPPRAATVTLPLQGTTIRNRPVPEDAQRHD
jgi:hypothetical protein